MSCLTFLSCPQIWLNRNLPSCDAIGSEALYAVSRMFSCIRRRAIVKCSPSLPDPIFVDWQGCPPTRVVDWEDTALRRPVPRPDQRHAGDPERRSAVGRVPGERTRCPHLDGL